MVAGLWTLYKPAMFRGRILKDSSVMLYAPLCVNRQITFKLTPEQLLSFLELLHHIGGTEMHFNGCTQ